MRNGERRTLDATIERRHADRLASADNPSSRSTEPDALGMSLMPLNPALRQQYELGSNANGVVVGSVDPNSEAARKGINEGDLIKRVGSQNVRAPSDVARAVEDARKTGRDTVLMLVQNGQGDRFVALKVTQG
jgi:serine protease Do